MRSGPLICLALCAALPFGRAAEDWPALHHDVARSGRSGESPAPPFTPMPRYHWTKPLCEEQINCYAEVIVADGLVYVGTYAGNMHALDRESGETVWTFKAHGPLRHSPAWHAGRLFFGSQDGFIYCVEGRTGKEVWKFRTEEGVWTSPAVAGGLVLMGSRDSNFYALDEAKGTLAWKLRTGAPILNSAAVLGEKVFFASEDGWAYCADLKSGQQVWKASLEMPLSSRGYFPVVWKDKVVFSVAIADWENGSAGRLRDSDVEFLAKRLGVGLKWGSLVKWTEPTDELLKAEQDDIVKRLSEKPGRKLVQCLDIADGKQSVVLPILYETGNNGTHSPPSVGADEALYLVSFSAFDRWGAFGQDWWKKPDKLVYPYGLGRIDPQTGRMTPVNWEKIIGTFKDWHGAAMEYEEHYNLSIGGRRIYVDHSDQMFGYEMDSRGVFELGGSRDCYAGIYGHMFQNPKTEKKAEMPGKLPIASRLGVKVTLRHEMHGPGRGAIAISGKDLFWTSGSVVICARGR